MYNPNFSYAHYQYFEEPQESHRSNLEILMENFNASQTYSYPNYFQNYQSPYFEEPQQTYNFNQTFPQPNSSYNCQTQYFEEAPEPYKFDLEILMEDFNESCRMISLFGETQKETLTYFQDSEESQDFNFETSIEDSDEMIINSRIESMIEHFIEAQTIQNEQSLQINETLSQLTIKVESLASHSMFLETQISQLEQNLLGPLPEEDVDVETTIMRILLGDDEYEESDIVDEESSDEKIVEIKKNEPTMFEKEVVKEAHIVISNHYVPLIPFTTFFMETPVDSQFKTHVAVMKNINTNAEPFEVLPKKRKLEDHKIRNIITVKRLRLTYEAMDEITKPKIEKLILRINPGPLPKFPKNKPPYKRKKRKGEGYVRWLDKWPWKIND